MKAVISIGVLASSLLLWMTAPAMAMQKEDSLFAESYAISQKLADGEQLFYLDELARVSTMAVPAPVQAQEWCLTEFRVATAQTNVRDRIAGQKNALQYLAALNPTMAMELLSQVEHQQPEAGRPLSEDLRADAAIKIFSEFLKSNPHGFSTVAAQAREIGETGQYPYRAVAAIIAPPGRDAPRPSSAETNGIVGDALSFYAHEKGYRNRDEEFLVLVRTLKGSAVDQELARQVVSTFARRLTQEPIQVRANYYSEIHTSIGNIVPFSDRNRAFLFEAFPAIDRFNRDLANQLRQQYHELAQATDEMQYISGGFVMGNPTTDEATSRHVQNIQQSLVTRIRELQDCDPSSAAQLAQRLTGISSRIAGFSSTVPAMAQRNPAEARSIYSRQLSDLGAVGDPPEKLDAAVALAQAAPSVGDLAGFRSLSSEAFDMGVRLFNSSTADRFQNRAGFGQLYDLVSFTASQATDSLKARIQQMPDNWLKAYLLLYEAEGHAKAAQLKKASSSPTAPCPD